MIDKSRVCKKQLEKIGEEVCVIRQNGSEESFFAVVQQTWRKNKSKFEDVSSKAGRIYNDYYMYIGPYNCDITKLGENDILICDGIKYYFVRSECVVIGHIVQFYTGILKRVWEGDSNVFE